MNILMITIPMAAYKRLLAGCDQGSREFENLANGFVLRDNKGDDKVQIPCGITDAEQLMRLIKTRFPKLHCETNLFTCESAINCRSGTSG